MLGIDDKVKDEKYNTILTAFTYFTVPKSFEKQIKTIEN